MVPGIIIFVFLDFSKCNDWLIQFSITYFVGFGAVLTRIVMISIEIAEK